MNVAGDSDSDAHAYGAGGPDFVAEPEFAAAAEIQAVQAFVDVHGLGETAWAAWSPGGAA